MAVHQLPSAKRAPVKTTKPTTTKPKETEKQRKARLAKARAAKKQLRERLRDDPDAVLTPDEWASLAGISPRVARGILNSGTGPVVTRLSARRLGIRRKHHLEWLERQAR